MKKSLLATVAAVALIAGTNLLSAEGAKEHGTGSSPAANSASGPANHTEMKRNGDTKAGAQLKGRSETTGGGSAEMKSEPNADTKAEGKADMKTNGKVDHKANAEKAKPSTTGQGEPKSGNSPSSAEEKTAPGKASEPSGRSATENRSGSATRSGAENRTSGESKSNSASTTERGGTAGASVNLSTEQKTKIRTTVLQSSNAPKVSRSSINFNISVGTVVPRDRVHYVAVTPALIEIHPEWRGHYYFVVDEEVIVVDSRGRIVAILDV
jgi:hypothetical protein